MLYNFYNANIHIAHKLQNNNFFVKKYVAQLHPCDRSYKKKEVRLERATF